MVQLLESEDAIETVITNLLEIVSRFLRISGGAVYKMKEDPEGIEVVAFWSKENSALQFPQDESFELPAILKTDKTFLIKVPLQVYRNGRKWKPSDLRRS